MNPSPWTPPTSFDEYRLVRQIGQGAMGQVFLGHDVLLDRPVALKFISAVDPDAIRRERFLTEGRAVARLAHPNVVTVYRVGEVAGRPYLAAEYVRGQSLDQLQKPLPWERVLSIGTGLARGLSAAHRRGILHRDIKPANAVLTDEGEVKLLDFGLAKFVLDEKLADSTQTAEGLDFHARSTEAEGVTAARTLLGTPRYMAPEALRGEPASRRSDVYSLGILLYELSVGQTPELRSESNGSMRPVSLEKTSPQVEPRFMAAVKRCIATDPAMRFASAEELLEALLQLAPEARGAALPKGNPYRGLRPFEAEHRALFFGRDADVRSVLERLRADALVIVAGDSGVGKSSLCKAGVLPLIEAGALGRSLEVSRIIPGRRPLHALAAGLSSTLETNEDALVAWIRSDPSALSRALRQHQQMHPGHARLLFVDQLEELFTLAEPAEAELFAEVLSRLCLDVPSLRVLATVRGDFFTRLAVLPGLGAEAARALYLLRPLSEEQVRETITGPLRRKQVSFESPEMVEALVASAARASGALPLLQFALAELWEARDLARGVITAAALERLGGVEGALARHADEVLLRLLPEQRVAARMLLLRLVTAAGTRARKTVVELGAIDAMTSAALEGLVQGRLLVARDGGAETTFEVAHEALLRGWGTLREWLEVDGDRRVQRQRLETAAAEWERLGRVPEALWQAPQLQEVQRLEGAGEVKLAEREQQFLAASKKELRWQRNRRRALIVAGPVLLLLAVVFAELRGKILLSRQVTAQLNQARAHLALAKANEQQAEEKRRRALALYQVPAEETERSVVNGKAAWDRAEDLWPEVMAAMTATDAEYSSAARSIETAIMLSPRDANARTMIVALTHKQFELAGRWYKSEADRARLRERLELYAPAEAARLSAPAQLRLSLDPPSAALAIAKYNFAANGRSSLGTFTERDQPLSGPIALEPGSYVLRFSGAGLAETKLPVLLRGDEEKTVSLRVPPTAAVPASFIYVPAGEYLSGSADPEPLRLQQTAPPMMVRQTSSFLISRYEVTFGEWLAFLDALPAHERVGLIPGVKSLFGSLSLERDAAGVWSIDLMPTDVKYHARWGEAIRYTDRVRAAVQDWRRMPVGGISSKDATAYLHWLDSTGRVRGARLCTEQEWERAARGADGRTYTTGEHLDPTDADIDTTYNRKAGGFGPDEVGSHPESASPFGVEDMEGNDSEIVAAGRASQAISIFTMGGTWYFDSYSARITNPQAMGAETRTLQSGLRICVSADQF